MTSRVTNAALQAIYIAHAEDDLSAIVIENLTKRYGLRVGIDGLDLRLKRWLEARGVRQKTYGTNYVPGHCNEFSRSSVDCAAKVCGLQIVDWQTYSHRPLVNLGFGRLGLGNKARVIVERGSETPGVGE